MADLIKNCRACGEPFSPRPWQIRAYDWTCLPCQNRKKKPYLERRKAASRPTERELMQAVLEAKDKFCLLFRKSSASECWLWTGYADNQGYGLFGVLRYQVLAHRASYFLHKGVIPGNLCVCHTCDVPSCVNPSHLFLGTVRDNALDKLRKGRASSKLSEDQVRRMLEQQSRRSAKSLAAEYGISENHVRQIIERKSWSWLEI